MRTRSGALGNHAGQVHWAITLTRPVWVHPGDAHFSQDQGHPHILHLIALQWSKRAERAFTQHKQSKLNPDQTGITDVPVSRGSCTRLSVSADCPKVTSGGLRNLGQLNLQSLQLSGLPKNSISKAVLGSLKTGYQLRSLQLGDINGKSPEEGISVSALVRYVSIYGHTGSYTGPDVGRLTHSRPRPQCRYSSIQTFISSDTHLDTV